MGQTTGPVNTKLPALTPLTNVVAAENDDSAEITFDPVDGAKDYRVYPLPNDGDINVGGDGAVTIHNATYRCAGTRETPAPALETTDADPANWMVTSVNQPVDGYMRTMAGATLGYVYTAPADGLIPVYALGDSTPNSDQECGPSRWNASRVKMYTTSDQVRTQQLAAFSRDDGIAFYVPKTPDATAVQIYVNDTNDRRTYLAAGPEADAQSGKMPAFSVLKSAVAGTTPLMRVYYANRCGRGHDELAVGQSRFDRAYKQGASLPVFSVLWTGITAPTTLVVEALDSGCPFQGHLSFESLPSIHAGSSIHQPWLTIDDVRKATPSGEVFINGQAGLAWDVTAGKTTTPAAPFPKAIARSFVNVTPKAHPAMDFFANFAPGSTKEAFADVPNTPGINCSKAWQQQSSTYDANFICTEADATGNPMLTFGPVMGELWLSQADNAADTAGKFRLTPKQMGTMSAQKFLHVTMEVDAYATARRYSQILISDQPAPIQSTLDKGHTLVIQPRAEITGTVDYPINYELQICNLRTWDVNQQCPSFDFHHVYDDNGKVKYIVPNAEVGEHASADHRVLFDVYASTTRAYLWLAGQPYGCANLPADGPPPAGPVTVTWGDVLYHSGVDHTFAFHADHMQIEQRRHFDNLGFSSGVEAPMWDETRFPCVAATSLAASQ